MFPTAPLFRKTLARSDSLTQAASGESRNSSPSARYFTKSPNSSTVKEADLFPIA